MKTAVFAFVGLLFVSIIARAAEQIECRGQKGKHLIALWISDEKVQVHEDWAPPYTAAADHVGLAHYVQHAGGGMLLSFPDEPSAGASLSFKDAQHATIRFHGFLGMDPEGSMELSCY